MDFISIKNEGKEFIYYFCNWWADNNKDTDLVEIILRDKVEITMYGRIKDCNLALGKEYFPVATEGQLRQFIEDNLHCNSLILWNTYYGKIYKHKVCFSNKSGFNNIELNRCENLLSAYWKMALEIAKEKVKA